MSVTFKIEGLDELRDALRRLPEELAGHASTIVQLAADRAIADMRKEYGPRDELTNRLYQSTLQAGRYGTAIMVKNLSGWAWHWDHGTKLRHTGNTRRQRHSTGAEWGGSGDKPPHTFERNMGQKRVQMYREFQALLVRAGLVVEVA